LSKEISNQKSRYDRVFVGLDPRISWIKAVYYPDHVLVNVNHQTFKDDSPTSSGSVKSS